MKATGKTAIILGATGLTGSHLLALLLLDKRYQKVILFSRSSVEFKHDKLEEHLVDLFQLKNESEKFTADEVFCCVGSTQAKTPDNEIYKKVDYGIPVTAAQLCKKNDISTFVVVSALGANKESRFFYNKTKGEMEQIVFQQKIPNTYVLRPSLISGKRKEKRPFEFVWKQIMKVANFLMFGPLKKYRSIHPKNIAKTMIFLANNKYNKQIIPSEEIKKIANERN